MSIHNPYLAPRADLGLKSTEKSIEKIKQFPHISTWAVIGLTIITLNLYVYYWLYTRTKILNRLLPEKPIAGWIAILTIVLMLLSQVFSLVPVFISMGIEFLNPEILGAIIMISPFVNLILVILFLIWIFSFRNRINILSESNKGSQFWLGGILTFFINVYYFQYKINQMHDHLFYHETS